MPDWGTRIPRLHSTVKTNKQTKNRASKQPGNNEQNANKYIPITNYHEVTKWIKKKTYVYAAYKRLTSDLKTYTD